MATRARSQTHAGKGRQQLMHAVAVQLTAAYKASLWRKKLPFSFNFVHFLPTDMEKGIASL